MDASPGPGRPGRSAALTLGLALTLLLPGPAVRGDDELPPSGSPPPVGAFQFNKNTLDVRLGDIGLAGGSLEAWW